MFATSFGIGPFNPAIRYYGRLWICERVSFENEDAAYSAAEGVVTYLNSQNVEYMNKLGYEPSKMIAPDRH